MLNKLNINIYLIISLPLDAVWREKDIHNTIYTMIHSSSKHFLINPVL